MTEKRVYVEGSVLQDSMTYAGEVVLTYKIEYPKFQSFVYKQAIRIMNKYYETKAYTVQRYCRKDLYTMAVEQYKYDLENDFPIRVFDAVMDFKITYNEECIISLYSDKYEYTGGAHGNTVRTSQTWNMQTKKMIELAELFPCSFDYKLYIYRKIKEQIALDPSIYFEDYEKLVVETFNPENYYATPEGLIIYYQQYDIAPYASGIREFLIPYSHCVINPKNLCAC
jgi:hypothetical protein